ncbi:MAG: hypothetical protein A2161_05450, partial [Candidatus Schekmanbacteria bacterium RBG_13_48_7]
PASKKANITYQIGNLYLDNIHNYEKALAAFVKVELLDPKGSLVKDARKNQVECLERLGRSRDAQEKLDQITSLKKKPEKGETIIAQIGERIITDRDFQKRLDQIPSYARDQFKTQAQKLEFLKQYIASELMYDTAKRKGLDKDPEIEQQVFETKKALIVQKLLKEEIQSQIKTGESDLELYFQAHKDDYRIKDRRHVRHILCKNRDSAFTIRNRILKGEDFEKTAKLESLDTESSGKGGDLGFITEDGYIPGIGKSEPFIKAVFKLKPNEISEPVQTDKGFHIIQLVELQTGRDVAYEEVKDRVNQDYTRMKQEEYYKQLIDRMLKAENVKIFDDKIDEIKE